MGKEKIDVTEMWIHGTVVDKIINAAVEYSGTENGDKFNDLVNKWKKLKNEWDELEKAKDYNLSLHTKFLSLTMLVLEVFNTIDPLKEIDGSLKTFNVPFRHLSLNSKEHIGYQMLFHEPPEHSALHWYHNTLGPLVYKKEKTEQAKIYNSTQPIEVHKRIKVKDYLKNEGLDKKNYKISLIGEGEIKPGRKNYLESGRMYLLIDSFGTIQTFLHLYHDIFGWYTRYFGHIVRGEHSSRFSGGGTRELIAPGMAMKVDTPISAKDFLANHGLSTRRYGISHVTMDMDLDTILVPNRSYMLIDKIQIEEFNRKMREMSKMFR